MDPGRHDAPEGAESKRRVKDEQLLQRLRVEIAVYSHDLLDGAVELLAHVLPTESFEVDHVNVLVQQLAAFLPGDVKLELRQLLHEPDVSIFELVDAELDEIVGLEFAQLLVADRAAELVPSIDKCLVELVVLFPVLGTVENHLIYLALVAPGEHLSVAFMSNLYRILLSGVAANKSDQSVVRCRRVRRAVLILRPEGIDQLLFLLGELLGF
mmetsp:Transcript_4530/g.8245  ORF Transcript_4530/g.8245 Transcript_4530/m.8245 type:complete len:212 (-) Transcript_4530:101-736(-)